MKSGTCAGSTPYRSRTSAGPDPGELAHALHRLQDRDPVADELEGVAVVGGDDDRAGPARRGRGEEVVGLVPAGLRATTKPNDSTSPGISVELLEQRVVEDAAGLVAGQEPRPGSSAPASKSQPR